jgi:hypothetical protein
MGIIYWTTRASGLFNAVRLSVSVFQELRVIFLFSPAWANDPNFPPNKGFPEGKGPGFDPIVGQITGASRATLGTNVGPQLTLPRDFVVSRGGEYFFTPSIRALKTIFSGVAV